MPNKKTTITNAVNVEQKTLQAVNLEGSIVKIKDTKPIITADYSISKNIIFTNEEPMVPINKYVSGIKKVSDVKKYFPTDGKTYKLFQAMSEQTPSVFNMEKHAFIIVPYNYTDAKGCKLSSIECDVNTFKTIGKCFLKMQYSAGNHALANCIDNTCDINKAGIRLKNAGIHNIYQNAVVEQKQDKTNKVVLTQSNNQILASANTDHVLTAHFNMENVETMDEVLSIFNSAGFPCSFKYINGQLVLESAVVGADATITLLDEVGTEDVNLKERLFGSSVIEPGTNGSGDDMIDLYNQYAEQPDFIGDIITTTAKLSIDELFDLNSKLVANISEGTRLVMNYVLPHPYACEITRHGTLASWNRSDLLNIACLKQVGDIQHCATGAMLSIACGQDIFNTPKYSEHTKDITLSDANIASSLNNEEMLLLNENGVSAISYIKGFGWSITIPSTNAYSLTDAVNIQNIIKTFTITLSNILRTNRSLNKDNQTMDGIKRLLYTQCQKLFENNVLTNVVSDFTQIQYNLEEAIKYITQTKNAAYIYIPDVKEIEGRRIPITIYFGFAKSVYGFTLENIYL